MQDIQQYLAELKPLKPFRDQESYETLANMAEMIEADEGFIFTRQYEPSRYFYFLLEGNVSFRLQIEEESENLTVGHSSEAWAPIGWSGFRSPNRYATTVTATSLCKAIRWSHDDLELLFQQYPDFGRVFLSLVIKKSLGLLDEVRQELTQYRIEDWDRDKLSFTVPESGRKADTPKLIELLRQSPFFEVFDERHLKYFTKIGKARYYVAGDIIHRQGNLPETFAILGGGKVGLYFNNDEEDIDDAVYLRSISKQGYIGGWAGGLENLHHDVTIIAEQDTCLFHFDTRKLHKYLSKEPEFGLEFTRRLLWLVSNHLRAARTRLISRQFDKEILAIRNLIEQNSTQLSVNSALHKIPHLLDSIFTLGDAFHYLREIVSSGNTLEKSLGNLCLEILGEVYKEHKFYQGLRDVYQSVVDADPFMSPAAVRKMCADKFTDIFEKVPYVIKGEEHLPKEGANIYIFNHLLNHSYNTLPNHFQLTLDSHFISSMILNKHFEDPGIRVVRVPKGVEYGHQNYYNRLGHIDVYTKESDQAAETHEERVKKREAFYRIAGDYLNKGHNLIISPEGTSYETAQSPGPFKSGAFRLAANLDPEPYIIPIAVANFDKRLNHTVLGVVIKKPFKVSEVIDNPKDNKEGMLRFLDAYQHEFRGYVQEAEEVARNAMHRRTIKNTFTPVKK